VAVEIRTCTADELGAFLRPTAVTLMGRAPDPARFGRFASMDPARMHAAVDDGEIVASAGAFTFELTAPGPRPVAAAGITVVGVLPSRRRRGLLRRLVDAQFDDARARREPVAILWSSETTIYGRFGYGIASEIASVQADPRELALVPEARSGVRSDMLDLAEAVRRIPPIYDRARRSIPGMLSRDRVWWEKRRLADDPALPETMLRLVVGDDDGGDRAYALLRIHSSWVQGRPQHELDVIEALGEDDAWTLEAWRFLLAVDLVRTLESELMPVDHPLFLAVQDPRALQRQVRDGLWLRLVDLPAALAARGYGTDGALVLEVTDATCPDNAGTWRLEASGGEGRAMRVDASPDLRLDAADVGAGYLGVPTLGRRARAGLIEEITPGAALRADRLLAGDRAPWCPENF
jgi:predicted acetyltransferase